MEYSCGCYFDGPIEYEKILTDPKYQCGQCPQMWELLQSGRAKGLWQVESQLGHTWIKKLKPENIEHLSALIAIMRPGVMNATDENGVNMAELYVRRKNGEDTVTYLHPALEPILNYTYGILVYQEQSMRIARDICGFTEADAETLRKGIGKKKADILAECKTGFLNGAKNKNIVPDEIAIQLWDNIEKSNRYQFNSAHSVSYALDLIYSAYAKAHKKLRFYASYLSHARFGQDARLEIHELVNAAKIDDIEVQTPDLRSPCGKFHIKNGVIRFGILDIKGVGEAAYEKLKNVLDLCKIFEPNSIDNLSWYNFLVYIAPHLSSSLVKALINSGSLDYLGQSRLYLTYTYDKFSLINEKELEWLIEHGTSDNLLDALRQIAPRKAVKKERDKGILGGGTHTEKRHELVKSIIQSIESPPYKLEDAPDWIASIEEESLGIAISYSRVDGCDTFQANSNVREILEGRVGTLVVAVQIDRIKEHMAKNKKKMAFLTVSDITCAMDNVVVFSDPFAEHRHLLTEKNTVLLVGKKDKNKGGFIVEKVKQI